jgi:MFS family permease
MERKKSMEKKTESTFSKIFKILIFASGVLIFDKISEGFLAKGQLKFVGAMLGASFIGLGIYFKKKMNANLFQILSYYLVVFLFGSYVFYTLLNPVLKITTMFKDLGMSISGVSSFLTIFSLTYGITQLFGGYILSKFKLFGYTAMMIFGSFCIFGQTISQDPFLFRLASGIFLSVSGIVVSFYPAKFWPKENLNFLINSIIFLGVKVACIGSNIAFLQAQKNPTMWKTLLTQNSFLMGGLSIAFVVFVMLFGKPVNEETEEKNSSIKKGESIIGEFLKLLVKDKRIIFACLFCAGTVMNFYFFRFSGYLVELLKSYFPGENDASAMNLFNVSNAYALLFGPMLLALISVESVLLIFSGIQFFALIPLLFFAKTNVLVVLVAFSSMGFGMAAHTFPPILFGRDYGEKKSAGLLFAILNFFPMFIGSYIGQKLGIYFAKKSWIATGSKMIDNQQIISGDNVIFAIKCLFPSAILAFLISIYLFIVRKKN